MTDVILADISNDDGQAAGFAAIGDPAVEAIYAKGTQGVTFRDPLWPVFRAEAKRAGKPIGAYAFLEPTVDGAAQAAYLLEYTAPVAGDLQPVVSSDTSASTVEETALTAYRALAALEAAGFDPLAGGSEAFWSKLVAAAPELQRFRYWQAEYSPVMTPVAGLETVLWQFTDSMAVGGGRFRIAGDRLLAASLEAIEYRPA